MKSCRSSWVFAIAAAQTVAGCVGTDSSRESKRSAGEAESKMTYTDITPEQAKRLVDSEGYLYLDVRTVPEFVAGHAPKALNIPVLEFTADGRRVMNDQFVSIVTAAIPKDAKLVVGCKTGGRSATACKLLAESGYKNLRNIDGGFMGVTDRAGQVVKEGWSTLGYPIERGDGESKSYESLRKKAP